MSVNENEVGDESKSASSRDLQKGRAAFLKNRFLSIKVKKQAYLGRPVEAVFLRDVSKKIHSKLTQLML